jgi:pantothenate synthetase
MLAGLAVVAYNRVVGNAKRAKSSALVKTLGSAKSMFASDPKTTGAMISAYNSAPDSNYASIAPYVRVNDAQPTDEADLLAKSGMPSTVSITLGTIDDRGYGGTHSDEAPTVNGY